MTQRPELEPDALIALAEEVYRPALAEAYGDDDPPIDISVTTSDDEAFITDEQDGETLLAVRRCSHGAEVLYRALLAVGRREDPTLIALRAELAAERKAKHDAREMVHVVMAAGEVAITKLKRFDQAEAAASSADMQRALTGVAATEPAPAAETKVRLGPEDVP